jgi:predicted alpha/beta hydrolase family esterase
MSRAVILHGRPGKDDEYYVDVHPSASNSHWIPWLQNQLLIAGHDAQTPEMFNAFQPEYSIWCQEFERYLVDEPMILVGHSTGAGFLVRWLSEHLDVQVRQLVLVAPWLDPDGDLDNGFFDFTVDESLPNRIESIHIFSSSDDDADITTSVETLVRHFPTATHHQYDDMGHFCLGNMGTDAFPDLLAVIPAANA